jgi:hypothetical protein
MRHQGYGFLGTLAVLSLGCGLAFLTGCDHCDDCDHHDQHADDCCNEVPLNTSYEPAPAPYTRSEASYESRRLHDSMYEPRQVESQSSDRQALENQAQYGAGGGGYENRRFLSEAELSDRRARLEQVEKELVLFPDRTASLQNEATILREEIRTSRVSPRSADQRDAAGRSNQNAQSGQAGVSSNPPSGQSQNNSAKPAESLGATRTPAGSAPAPSSSSAPGAPAASTQSNVTPQSQSTQAPISTSPTLSPGVQPTNVQPSQTQTGEASSTVTTPTGEKVTTPLSGTPSPNTYQPNPAQPSGTLNTEPNSGLQPQTPGAAPSSNNSIYNPTGPATGPTGAGNAPNAASSGGNAAGTGGIGGTSGTGSTGGAGSPSTSSPSISR